MDKKTLCALVFAALMLVSPAVRAEDPDLPPEAMGDAQTLPLKVYDGQHRDKPGFGAGRTVTIEKTTEKTYTLTNRRLGLIGKEAYAVDKKTVDGGMVVERMVNGKKDSRHVLRPDPMLDKAPEYAPRISSEYKYPFREYYTDTHGLKKLGDKPVDVEVYDNGSFNN